jgi:hypothetical protein
MVYWTFIYTSCNKKMVLTREINIIAISRAELFSAVLFRALACSGVHWHALACTGVLWRAFACFGVHWRTLAYSNVHWRALACIGVLSINTITTSSAELFSAMLWRD